MVGFVHDVHVHVSSEGRVSCTAVKRFLLEYKKVHGGGGIFVNRGMCRVWYGVEVKEEECGVQVGSCSLIWTHARSGQVAVGPNGRSLWLVVQTFPRK